MHFAATFVVVDLLGVTLIIRTKPIVRVGRRNVEEG